MKNLSYLLIVICLITLFSCDDKDEVSAPDPNQYLGTWRLVSSFVDNDAIVLDECSEKSKLILYWFSEQDPINNAELYDYAQDENEECAIIENIDNASWFPTNSIDNSGNFTPTVYITFLSRENDTVRLNLDRQDDFLIVSGQLSIDGQMLSIRREYRKLKQQI